MAEIVLDTAGGQAAGPFRNAVGGILASLHGRQSGRAVLDAIGAWNPGYPATIVIRRAVAGETPPAPQSRPGSLDRLLEQAPGGSSIGHTTTMREIEEEDTSTDDERAWQAIRGRSYDLSPSPSRSRITSRSVPLILDPSAAVPDAEMLHELVHALRELQGHSVAARLHAGPRGYRNNEEFHATLFENVLRSEMRVELRKGYEGVDAVFVDLERRIGFRTNRPTGTLVSESSRFPEPPTDDDIAWVSERFADAHRPLLNALRNQNADLITRFAAINADIARFNPFRPSRTGRAETR